METWNPPSPEQLPELRGEMLEWYSTEPAMVGMRNALAAGQSTITPHIPGVPADPASVGAGLLLESERLRLAQATLYYATGDTTALALAAAQNPPKEPVRLDRPPAPAGFMLFAEPIGGYVQDVGASLAKTRSHREGVDVRVTVPIVAVSWSRWTPDEVTVEGKPVTWAWHGQGRSGLIPRDYPGLWLTFYSPRGALYDGLAPETVIGTMRDGSAMTAGMVAESSGLRGPTLNWDNESLLRQGAPLGEAAADSTGVWAHVVYTAWQLMTEAGRTQWTEAESVPRARAGVKRDRRHGVIGPSEVQVVRVARARQPSRQAAELDAAGSSGRREPQFIHRWPVRPHRRDHCMNPGGHTQGECSHEERLIPGHVKGPDGAPLRVRETVHLWDQ